MSNTFEVEQIVAKRTKKNRIQYFVKWLNYDESENSWEDEDNILLDCHDLIEMYEKNCYYSAQKKYIVDIPQLKGNIAFDMPFLIIGQTKTQFLISFYPRNYQEYVGSTYVDKSLISKELQNEYQTRKENQVTVEYLQQCNDRIGCVLKVFIKKSLVVLLSNYKYKLVDNDFLLDQYPELFVIKSLARPSIKLLQVVQTSYQLRGNSSEEVQMNLDKIIHDHNRKHDKSWIFEDTRLYEVPRPSRYKDLYQREVKRKQDRRTIAFLCKHVMAERDVKIPMK